MIVIALLWRAELPAQHWRAAGDSGCRHGGRVLFPELGSAARKGPLRNIRILR